MQQLARVRTPGVTRRGVRAAWRRHAGDARRVAAEFGVSSRTVRRWVVGWGIAESAPHARFVDSLSLGVQDDLAHGMPANWAAEGADHHRKSTSVWAARNFPERAEHLREWQRVWPTILKNPALRALHDEFAPK